MDTFIFLRVVFVVIIVNSSVNTEGCICSRCSTCRFGLLINKIYSDGSFSVDALVTIRHSSDVTDNLSVGISPVKILH